jgi:hypothetical protein
MYETYNVLETSTVFVNTYKAQRPSVAACKAFTQLQKKSTNEMSARIEVKTVGTKRSHIFHVEYKEAQEGPFGPLRRPVATIVQDFNNEII